MKQLALRIAGFGFRREATVGSLGQALDQLVEHYGAIDKLAAELGRLRHIEVIAVSDAELPTVTTLTHSTQSMQARGTGSVAEAVALLAAGHNAKLVGSRIISADRQATAALALAEGNR